jgi:hypothetical protein
MPSIAQLLPLIGKGYQRKCIELGIIGVCVKSKRPPF